MTDLSEALALSLLFKALELGQITLKQFYEETERYGLSESGFQKEMVHPQYYDFTPTFKIKAPSWDEEK